MKEGTMSERKTMNKLERIREVVEEFHNKTRGLDDRSKTLWINRFWEFHQEIKSILGADEPNTEECSCYYKDSPETPYIVNSDCTQHGQQGAYPPPSDTAVGRVPKTPEVIREHPKRKDYLREGRAFPRGRGPNPLHSKRSDSLGNLRDGVLEVLRKMEYRRYDYKTAKEFIDEFFSDYLEEKEGK